MTSELCSVRRQIVVFDLPDSTSEVVVVSIRLLVRT